MKAPFILSDALSYEYSRADDLPGDEQAALRDVTVAIDPGAFVAVLGRNGSGKSTLARHLNALLTPSAGTLWVKGMITREAAHTQAVRQSVGMVFQNPDSQLVATTVEEDVAFGPENLNVPMPELRRRVDSALAAVGMEEAAKSAPQFLSGGQKQRVAIAGVLAMRPDCVVLDEPTAMLDPSGRREVLDTVRRLNREQGITVILITHYMEEAAMADRLIVMDGGRVAMDGRPGELFLRVDEMRALGLDVPQTALLTHILRGMGLPVADALTVEDFAKDPFTEKLAAAARKRSKPMDGGFESGGDSEATRSVASCSNVARLVGVPNETSVSVPLLEIRRLTHVYNPGAPFAQTAVRDVSLTIRAGECVGIIGHTGSGKSTLIQHFNALLKPTSGQVLLDGADVHADRKRLKEVRRRVGLVFQYPEHQLFDLTVLKDVAFGPSNFGLSPEEAEARAREALESVGLPEAVYEKSPFELSGGQKRRAAIAGVLATQPDILILDEPTAGLDPAGREEIFAQLNRLRNDSGRTVVLVTHSMEDIARFASRIVVLCDGAVLLDGPTAAVFAEVEKLEAAGLALPQIAQCCRRLRALGIDAPTDVFTAPRAAEAIYRLAQEAGLA